MKYECWKNKSIRYQTRDVDGNDYERRQSISRTAHQPVLRLCRRNRRRSSRRSEEGNPWRGSVGSQQATIQTESIGRSG